MFGLHESILGLGASFAVRKLQKKSHSIRPGYKLNDRVWSSAALHRFLEDRSVVNLNLLKVVCFQSAELV